MVCLSKRKKEKNKVQKPFISQKTDYLIEKTTLTKHNDEK